MGGEKHTFLENGYPIATGLDVGYLPDTPTRVKIDLSGEWEFSVEGGRAGTVQIPAAGDFIGSVAFKRNFDIPSELLDTYQFHVVVLGANYNVDVFVNGEFVGNHAGGYTSHAHPLPDNLLQTGPENVIQVGVDNRLDPRTSIPTRQHAWGWRNYIGITRDIYLLGTPPLFISDARVTSEVSGSGRSARIHVRASIERPWSSTEDRSTEPPKLGFVIEVVERLTGAVQVESRVIPVPPGEGLESIVEGDVRISAPSLWSPSNPDLYLVRCSLLDGVGRAASVLDRYDVNTGIRTLEIADGDILLNRERVVLNGTVWYEDHPTWGNALSYEERERDIVLVKNMGANAIRFANHPPHPYMLNLCDRYGLLALVEIPISYVPGSILAGELFRDGAERMFTETILRDRNHPSVMAWGLGNEFETAGSAARDIVGSLVRIADSLDTRPTYFGARGGVANECTELVDIAALNLYTTEQKELEEQLIRWRDRHREQPVIVSRFGTEVQHDNLNGYADPLSQHAQARFFLQGFARLRRTDFDGGFVWAFNDWKGDRPALAINSGDPWVYSLGVVSGHREKRIAYDAVRSVFRGRKFAALPMGSHTSDAPIVYVLVGFVVLIGVVYLYNSNRRFRESLIRSMVNSYNFFADIRDQHLVSIIHSSLLGLAVTVAMALVVSSILYHFRGSWFLDTLLSYLTVSDGLKTEAINLIRDPLRSIVLLSVLGMLVLFLLIAAVLFLRVILKTRVLAYHAYTVTMWSTPPLLVLIPMGMILYRVMESSIYVLPALLIVGLLLFWVAVRFLKAVSIIYDVRALKMYVLGFVTLVFAVSGLYIYYDATQMAPSYVSFMYDLLTDSW
ncbi:MAG: glycoside hydrolase family 2 TIM barrel-domain containing protein [Bacteroidota bacterium]